jgi:hypothetical protein
MTGLRDREMQVKASMVAKTTAITALLLSVTLQLLSIAPGYAQTEDSLLPPEVIPVDSGRAPSLQSQDNGANANGNVPGLVGGGSFGGNPAMSGSSAQAMRQQMMNSLMGQGVYPQFQGQKSASPMNNAASQTFSAGAPGLSPAPGAMPGNNGNNQALGQSGWNTPGQQNMGQGNTVPAQSQMLSGGVQNQTPQAANRQGSGYSHGFSALSGFGLSALGMGMGLRSSPSAFYGGGGAVAGAGLLNYGFRNGFRF